MRRILTDKFTYDPSTRTFFAEMSDLGPGVFDRAYSDACDLGFTLVSLRTGRVVDYVISKECLDHADGGVVAWELTPTTDSLRRVPGASNTTVRIFND